MTEDLFYWNNAEDNGDSPKLKIQPNSFINWIINRTGSDEITDNFKRYTNTDFEVSFDNEFYDIKKENNLIGNGVSFVDKKTNEKIKISQGETRNFIWCVFYTFLEYLLKEDNLNRDEFKDLKYIFIDDPVSSLDDNHLISLAINLAELVKKLKKAKNSLRFIITTHNPLFYNVIFNSFKNDYCLKSILRKLKGKESEEDYYELISSVDSPFSYHLYLLNEVVKARNNGKLRKYHFSFMRNIIEKTSTFLGYSKWQDLFNEYSLGTQKAEIAKLLDISSHSKHSAEEISILDSNTVEYMTNLLKKFQEYHKFKIDEEI